MRKKAMWIVGAILGIVLLAALALLAVIGAHSPGKLPADARMEGKGISEKVYVEINGVQQGMFIRGENRDNPVVLFLHGGPGSPELPMIYAVEGDARLEEYYTVCYWDQRGAGMTRRSETDPATMTVEQLIADTVAVTDYLRERFGQRKITLMGHSWGSYLGVKTAEARPDLYRAYIGIGQVTDQTHSERLAYEYMREHAEQIGDRGALEKLDKYDVNAADFPTNAYITSVRTELMNKYGIGVDHKGTPILTIVKEILSFPGYTLGEKFAYVDGMNYSLERLFGDVTQDNLFLSSPKLDIPAFVVHGKYDYQVSQVLAEEYVRELEAPDKAFFLFEHSAHSPNMEEMERFVQIVRDIHARPSVQ